MAKKTVTCDVCGVDMDYRASYYDDGTGRDLCERHFLECELQNLIREADRITNWLKETHLKKLSELKAEINLISKKLNRMG